MDSFNSCQRDPFSTVFMFASQPLDPSRFRAQLLTWGTGGDGGDGGCGSPSYTEIRLAAREFALIYCDSILIMPQVDKISPRLWIIRARQQQQQRRIRGIRPLEERIRARGLKGGRSVDQVDPEVLEHGLQFSIESRMSPLWNRVGNMFLQGRQFLRQNDVFAVRAELRLSSDFRVFLALRGGQVRFPPVKLETFMIEPLAYQRFMENIITEISDHYIGMRTVYALPNLTRGTVVSISKKMLTSPGLHCWKDMRRYWKNMYGYRLEDEEPKFYCNLAFGWDRSILFSYPEFCIRAEMPVIKPRVNPREIVDQFVYDLKAKSSNICGEVLDFRHEEFLLPASQLLASSVPKP